MKNGGIDDAAVLLNLKRWRSGRLDIHRCSLAALGGEFVAHLLAFVQRGEAGLLRGGDMHEHVVAAIGRLDRGLCHSTARLCFAEDLPKPKTTIARLITRQEIHKVKLCQWDRDICSERKGVF